MSAQRRIFNAAVETADRETIEALQWRRLRTYIDYAYAQSPFFRDKLLEVGLRPEDVRSLEDFRERVPTIDKTDLLVDQEAAEPYGRRLAVQHGQVGAIFMTSGSSGHAQEIHAFTETDIAEVAATWMTSLHWAGLEPGDVGYLMMPVGVTLGPASMLAGFQRYGLQVFAVGAMAGEARLETMRRFPPAFFASGPVYLRRLTNLCRQLDIDPRRDFTELKSIKLGTLGYTAAWAQEMEDFWGVRLADSYASTQAAAATACTCEEGVVTAAGERTMMHLPEHKALMEIIDPDTGRPVGDGEEGELILTPFDRQAMPLIRFRTGDRVRRLSYRHCPCGRALDGIETGTVSRYDNMLKVRGMNLWTDAVDAVVLASREVDDYNGRVRVDDRGREVAELLVLFHEDPGLDAGRRHELLAGFEGRVKEQTNVRVIAIEAEDGEVRKVDYKERRWRDLRKETM
jgi:phenylacetate-CoA ligase